MSGPGQPGRYEIRVDAVLDDRWADWFGGLQVTSDGTQTVISGLLPDQPALHGLLTKIRDLGLSLISVRRLDTEDAGEGRGNDTRAGSGAFGAHRPPATSGHASCTMTADGHPAAAPGEDLQDWLAAAQVADEVRELRPDYAALLIVAGGLRPGPSDEASEAILAAAERRALSQLAGSSPEDLPQVAQWREAFRSFGAKPQRTRPSVEALLRRLAPGLPRIDRITDAYNATSIACLLPVGGEDLARYSGPARLVRADGREEFDTVANGQPALEHPDPGEVIWRDDRGVTCRRWNWRQCTRTQITTSTTTAVFILDRLAALGTDGLHAAAAELTESLGRLSPGARFASREIRPADHGVYRRR